MEFGAVAAAGVFVSISHFQALAYANLQQRPLNMIKVFHHP